ncbi:hypothetical protein EIP86_008499 [Pleurotus ostreatoroseus]|nr:hypothetical protein EIP86_008499 [Pleurotus ostreatoroseus]
MPKTRVKRLRSPSLERQASGTATNQSKKLKLLESHALESPFPDFTSPTPAEARQVHDLLSQTHPDVAVVSAAASTSNDAAGTCGKVSNVLESLIGTILSQNTSGRNSTAAKQSLDKTFGRNNFEAIADADKAAVVDAIRMGGLANKKAEVIQRILKQVKAKYGTYSLQHLAGVMDETTDEKPIKTEDPVELKAYSNEDAMKELVSFEGVGPKTAADRVTAQAHLDIKIPSDLKYGLHVLMVQHGRRCKGCKSSGSGKGECVLKSWLRTRKGLKSEELDNLTLKIDDEAEEKLFDEQA